MYAGNILHIRILCLAFMYDIMVVADDSDGTHDLQAMIEA